MYVHSLTKSLLWVTASSADFSTCHYLLLRLCVYVFGFVGLWVCGYVCLGVRMRGMRVIGFWGYVFGCLGFGV